MKSLVSLFLILFLPLAFKGSIPSFILQGSASSVDSLIQISEKSSDNHERIVANNHLGIYYESISNYKLAIQHLYAADKLNSSFDANERIITYNYLGYVFWHKSDYKMALYYHNTALKIAGDSSIVNSNLAFTYLMTGGDYYDLGDYERTSEFYFKALKQYEKLNDDVGRLMAHNRLSKLYYKLKDLQRSKEQANRAQQINSHVGYIRETAVSFNCLGNVYIESGATDSALHYFKKTLFYFKKSGDVIGQAIASINLGDTYFQQYKKSKLESDLEEAYLNYQMSYMLNSRVDNKFGMIYGLWGVADIDAGRGNTELALKNYHKALTLSRSINAKSEQYNLYQKIYILHEEKGQT
ncbi:MAG: tetratricopeptide repeat protein, partial [Bacteroidota bacterium]|nr:tetratricopeptide repeat protein [Bacteroidota bacterium]